MNKEKDITIEEKALALPDQARNIKVFDQNSLSVANKFILWSKSLEKEIDASYDPIIKKAHGVHKEAVGQKKKIKAPLLEARGIVSPRVASYLVEQERIRRKAEEKHAKEIAKAVLKAAEEEEARNKEAEEAMENGDFEKAEEIMDTPVAQVAAIDHLVPKAPKTTGLSVQTRWKFRIIDEAKIPRDYMKPDEVKIGQIVRAMKGKLAIPGVQIYPDDSLTTRA